MKAVLLNVLRPESLNSDRMYCLYAYVVFMHRFRENCVG